MFVLIDQDFDQLSPAVRKLIDFFKIVISGCGGEFCVVMLAVEVHSALANSADFIVVVSTTNFRRAVFPCA